METTQPSKHPQPLPVTAPPPAAAVSAPPGGATAPPTASAAPRRRSRRPFVILGLVAALAVAAIQTIKMITAGQESTDDAQVAADTVPIGTRVSGLIVRVHIQENQRVKRGDLLIEIDPAETAAHMAQAEAELATAKAQTAVAEAQMLIVQATSRGGLASARAALVGSTVGVGSADAQVAAAKAALVHAQSDDHKAALDLARAQELRRANALPQERLDAAQSAFDGARAALAQAQAQLALAQEVRRAADSRVGEARGRVSQSAPIEPQIAAAAAGADLARARVRSAEASVALAKLQLGYTRVVAPTDGIASKLTAHEGQLVAIGQSLVELVPIATYVVANFKETQVGKMRPGQRAKILLDAFPGTTFNGHVESLSGGTGASFSLLPADNASGNFVKVVERVPVRIAWVNPSPAVDLRAGLSADVTVYVDK